MEKVLRTKELKVVIDDKAGLLAGIVSIIADKGVNIENICVYTYNGKAAFHLLTADNKKAKKVLEAAGYTVQEIDVIVLSMWNRPGALADVAAKFKEKDISIRYAYGTSTPAGQRTAIVFASEDNDAASGFFRDMVLEEGEKSV